MKHLFETSPDQKVTIRPEKFTEIIVLNNPDTFPKPNQKPKYSKPTKNQFPTVKDLVGKRVNIRWKAGKYKGWHIGAVIGYTSNLNKSIIYYDKRNTDVDPAIDYYSQNLLTDPNNEWEVET